jgi:hypothetical protein
MALHLAFCFFGSNRPSPDERLNTRLGSLNKTLWLALQLNSGSILPRRVRRCADPAQAYSDYLARRPHSAGRAPPAIAPREAKQ